MEKIKDFFYYVGDFIVCIIILSLMYFLITWKLDDSIPVDVATGAVNAESSSNIEEENKVLLDVGVGDEKNERPSSKSSQPSDDKNRSDEEKNQSESAENKGSEAENQDESENQEIETNSSVTSMKIQVTSGMNGVDIAYMLEEKGIIDSADLFVAKMESMDKAGSLLAGEFEVEKGMSYEDIVNILTGGN